MTQQDSCVPDFQHEQLSFYGEYNLIMRHVPREIDPLGYYAVVYLYLDPIRQAACDFVHVPWFTEAKENRDRARTESAELACSI